MSNNKQSSIEWLIEQLTPSISLQQKHIDDLKEQAKAIHRVEIMQAVNDGKRMGFGSIENLSLEQYYEKEFT